MAYLTFVDQPERQFCTHQLVDRRMCEIASAYKKWCAEYEASDPDRNDPNGVGAFWVVDDYVGKVKDVVSDMLTYGLIPTANDPDFDLWAFSGALYDKYLSVTNNQ